jgi:hypothetical protein
MDGLIGKSSRIVKYIKTIRRYSVTPLVNSFCEAHRQLFRNVI